MGLVFLALFFALLALSFAPIREGVFALFSAFYRSGALVFGGGHVVLPLLRNAVVVPGWVSDAHLLAGYGAAQAVPGPLFTFSAYLGAVATIPPGGVTGAVIALVAIFVPGILVLMGTLPFWHDLRARPDARAAMAGINAAVVGLLAAALYNPVWVSAVQSQPTSAWLPPALSCWSSGARRRCWSCWPARWSGSGWRLSPEPRWGAAYFSAGPIRSK